LSEDCGGAGDEVTGLLRATTGKIKWWQAAELIGIGDRHASMAEAA